MNWNNVKLIFLREMRDQLRDRRTLFLIAVLPLLLYPLLGTSFFQMTQFLRHQAATVLVVGDDQLSELEWLPPLFAGEQFDVSLFASNPNEFEKLQPVWRETPSFEIEQARQILESGEVQAVLFFPEGFGERLTEARRKLLERVASDGESNTLELPEPQILFQSANEKSQLAKLRLDQVLRTWRTGVMQTNLRDSDVPIESVRPFQLQPQDVSKPRQRQAAVWSKILPFVLFLWALTGAFYPAIDLCAGEKERGTLETLLVSPALRREIVWGKMMTIFTFSMVTALLNLGSLGVTGQFVLAQLSESVPNIANGSLSMPPLICLVWLAIALVPVAALFSALCLACAAFARSTKEGQYYLMPLLLVTMPLMMLPMAPGVELTLGNSLIPITGVVLLLRSFIEGQYWEALPYVLPVLGVTLTCCLLAIRWAEEQFNSESVLFRESERLDLGRWLVHLVRDRMEMPSVAQAALCVVAISLLQFFVGLIVSAKSGGGYDYSFLVQSQLIVQVLCIALPAGLMALMLTRNPAKTLLLDRMPNWRHLLAGGMLAVLIRPLGIQLAIWIEQLYPFPPETMAQMKVLEETMRSAPHWWIPLLLLTLLPALCEELAFRGFVLSGLRRLGHKWWAIGLSAVAFGMAHSILQQKLAAIPIGFVIGYLAVQTSTLWACVVFHAVYNGLALGMDSAIKRWADGSDNWVQQWILHPDVLTENAHSMFQPWFLAASTLAAVLVLWWLHYVPYRRTNEECLQEARQRQLAKI